MKSSVSQSKRLLIKKKEPEEFDRPEFPVGEDNREVGSNERVCSEAVHLYSKKRGGRAK